MIKITIEMIDDDGHVAKTCTITDDFPDQFSPVYDIIDDVIRAIMGVGYYPGSVWEALETWVENHYILYGEGAELE